MTREGKMPAPRLQYKREKKAARRRAIRAMRKKAIQLGGKAFDVEKRFQRMKLEKHIRRIKRKIKKGKS